MRKPDSTLGLPPKFIAQYRKNILVRSVGGVVLVAVGAFFCTVMDFFASKYPMTGRVLVLLGMFAVACLAFRLDLILFKPSWMGVIRDIIPKKESRVKLQAISNLRVRLIVHLYIDRGEGRLYDYELWNEGMEHAGERTENGVKDFIPANKFYDEAPYKVGDVVVYLRGLRYPFRFGVDAEGMFDVRYVCPFCGEINKNDRKNCYRCGRELVKDITQQ